VSVKSVALPVEHGGWGMLGEPLLAGLVLAPTVEGAGLAVAAVGAFLARHPLKLALGDVRRAVRYPRTALALRVAGIYGAVAVAGLLVAAWRAPVATWIPLLVAAPLGAVQLWYDARLQGRQLVPEIFGGVALGATASSLLLAGGWAVGPALAVWLLLAAKAVAAVLYVRARLRRDRGQPASRGPALATHAVALAGSLGLAIVGWAPRLAVAAFTILLARAVHGLSSGHRVVRPQAVGFAELGFGLLTTALLAAGYAARL
jgi:hypothetical protein